MTGVQTCALPILTAIAEDSGARLITQAELLGNAADVEGDTLTVSNVAIASGNGSLVDNGNGTWSYTPALNDDTAQARKAGSPSDRSRQRESAVSRSEFWATAKTAARRAKGAPERSARSIEPRAGCWTLPAGFLELGETTEEGAAREAREESLARIEVGPLLLVFNVPHLGQVHLFYRARLRSPGKATAVSLAPAGM